MTTDQFNFLVDINLEYLNQGQKERTKASISIENRMLRRYLLLLKRVYAKMLNEYLAPMSLTESNFMTEEEAQDVLDRYNLLCNTDYTGELTITDVEGAGPSTVWDDTLIWGDDDFWVES